MKPFYKYLIVFVFLFVSLFLGSDLYSQKLYFNFGLGYNYNAAASYQFTNNIDVITVNGGNSYLTGINYSLKDNVSFGAGKQYGVTIGYLTAKNFCFELNVSYLKGNEYVDIYTEQYQYFSNIYTQIFKSQMLRFAPSIRLSTGSGKFQPYLKTGLVIGAASQIHVVEYYNLNYQSSIRSQNSEFDLKGGVSFGFAGGIGFLYAPNSTYGIFSELNIVTQSWAPERMSYSKIFQNNIDVLSQVPVNIKESVFVESFSSSVPNSNTDSPSEKLKQYFPFSSIGWNIGIYFRL